MVDIGGNTVVDDGSVDEDSLMFPKINVSDTDCHMNTFLYLKLGPNI